MGPGLRGHREKVEVFSMFLSREACAGGRRGWVRRKKGVRVVSLSVAGGGEVGFVRRMLCVCALRNKELGVMDTQKGVNETWTLVGIALFFFARNPSGT